MDQPAPVNYVAGLGRGATGFTTRSDIGPARISETDNDTPARPPTGTTRKNEEEDDKEDYSESVYDEFEGYGGSFSDPNATYEQDDKEADEIYEGIDKRMDSKRKERREARLRLEIEKFRATRPKIQQQFADLKKELDKVSMAEWENIPEIGDHTMRYKKKAKTDLGFLPVPDSLLEKAKQESEHFVALDARQQKLGGLSTPLESGLVTPIIGGDLTQLGAARKTVLGINLNKIQDSVGGQTNVDPKDYLTDLKSVKINSDAEISDLNKARLLLKSVRTTNPRHAPAWIASARLEEVAGKLAQARRVITEACHVCPENDDWLEAARLHPPADARELLARALTALPLSVTLWLAAAALEDQIPAKRRVLRRALEARPNSVKLWKAAVELEDPTDARVLLARAVECVPHSVEIWLALARLEPYDLARRTLNRAHKAIPTDLSIWLAAAKLEESHRKELSFHAKSASSSSSSSSSTVSSSSVGNTSSNGTMTDKTEIISSEVTSTNSSTTTNTNTSNDNNAIDSNSNSNSNSNSSSSGGGGGGEDDVAVWNIVRSAVRSLQMAQVIIPREQWLREAEAAEATGAVVTCQALVRETIGVGVEDEDRKRVWVEDATACLSRGSIETARAIYAHALSVFPGKKSLWLRVAQLEKMHGTPDTLDATLRKAVTYCPQAEILWLMAAKEQWMRGHVDEARHILASAFDANADSEQVWLAAVKLESETREYDRARGLLRRARERAGTERVWLKSALLERELGHVEEERTLLDEALTRYPQFPKFWLMRAQFEERAARFEEARAIYQRALLNCPHSVALWIGASRLEERASLPSKARSLLEKARLKNPRNPELWLEAIRVERRVGSSSTAPVNRVALALLAKALQECPTSGLLWAEAIESEKPSQKKARSVDALKKCDNDPHVVVAVAKLFWSDRKLDKARTWFNRAVSLDGDLGDAWAYYYLFEIRNGSEEQQQQVLKRCIEAEPRHGEKWIEVSKDIANVRWKTEQILKKVVANLSSEFQ